MPRTYVDNATNRSLGRVGMAHGSAVHSSSSRSASSSASAAPRTYVDNSYNRSHGRVGLEVGSAVISGRSSSSSTRSAVDSPRTYVDNSMNRNLGRVGMVHGSAVQSSSSTSASSRSNTAPRTYVDNSYNRSHGRVGLDFGTAVISGNSGSSSARSSGASQRTYVDNSYNRKHGRVGKPLGTVTISKGSTKSSTASPRTYVDNSYNRSLGRVGKPLGSMVVSSNSSSKRQVQKVYKDVLENGQYDESDLEYNYGEDFAQMMQEMFERMKVWESVMHEKQLESKQRPSTFDSYVGKVIEFNEIDLGEKIGHGGFGDVFAAIWQRKDVAVKKLRVQRVSQKRLAQFEGEINIFSELNHKNIVRFYGACIKTPNICMVMELMSDSLYDAIHCKQRQFSDRSKYFIMKEVADGLYYLHSKSIAHCDIKSTNVLINIFEQNNIVVKLTDFGLSLIKNDTETTTSKHQFHGTPRYSAPEILRGELLSKSDMEKADVYSYGLLAYEILCEEEPFETLNNNQLRKQVGECGVTPPLDMVQDRAIKNLLQRCWLRQAKQRPKMVDVLEELQFYGL